MSGNLQHRQIDGPDPFYEVGVRVMREAGRPHDFYPMEGSGFKPELYANGQDSDVYLHIYGFAGGTILVGKPGSGLRFCDSSLLMVLKSELVLLPKGVTFHASKSLG